MNVVVAIKGWVKDLVADAVHLMAGVDEDGFARLMVHDPSATVAREIARRAPLGAPSSIMPFEVVATPTRTDVPLGRTVDDVTTYPESIRVRVGDGGDGNRLKLWLTASDLVEVGPWRFEGYATETFRIEGGIIAAAVAAETAPAIEAQIEAHYD